MSDIIIPLTRGYSTVVDECDSYLSGFSWFFVPDPKSVACVGYAARNEQIDGTFRMLLMHRAILRAGPKALVDHRDGDGLNNRRSNLRTCSHQQNMMNCGPRTSGKSSRYKGVSKTGRRYYARLGRQTLGRFDSEIEAAIAYDLAAERLHGDFAWLNRNHFCLDL